MDQYQVQFSNHLAISTNDSARAVKIGQQLYNLGDSITYSSNPIQLSELDSIMYDRH